MRVGQEVQALPRRPEEAVAERCGSRAHPVAWRRAARGACATPSAPKASAARLSRLDRRAQPVAPVAPVTVTGPGDGSCRVRRTNRPFKSYCDGADVLAGRDDDGHLEHAAGRRRHDDPSHPWPQVRAEYRAELADLAARLLRGPRNDLAGGPRSSQSLGQYLGEPARPRIGVRSLDPARPWRGTPGLPGRDRAKRRRRRRDRPARSRDVSASCRDPGQAASARRAGRGRVVVGRRDLRNRKTADRLGIGQRPALGT